MKNKKILVIEDEYSISELIKMNLEKSGYTVSVSYTGLEGIEKAQQEMPSLILLDLMLPDVSGLEVCSRVRLTEKTARIPIIILTAKSEETDKVIGLGLGADDYMTKPFGLRELEARIGAVLRRVEEKEAVHNETKEEQGIIKIQDIVVDTKKHVVEKDGIGVDLTLTEFKLLTLLAENRGKVMSREVLLNELTGEKGTTELRTVDVHIRNLRKKIEDTGQHDKYIETIRGVGYKMK